MDDLLTMVAGAQARAMASGQVRAVDVMAATLARVAEVNGAVNALVTLAPEADLMAAARAVDAGGALGPLHGVPVAIKDLANAAGFATSQGSPIFAGQVAARDDAHVARLRAAGAIVIGKSNVPEFGIGSQTYNPVFGATGNPYDLARSAGGSSGGAAAALALGMVQIADGSDMMGSLRNPAAWCNVYGMRPTWGVVPAGPSDEVYLHHLSTNGPMARSPEDMALLLDVMAGPVAVQPFGRALEVATCPAVPRIGWLGDWGGAYAMAPGILELCEAALAPLGAVEALGPPMEAGVLWESWCVLRSWAIGMGLAEIMGDARRAQLKPEAVWEAERGLGFTGADIHAASVQRSAWRATAMQLFERFDVLALPAAQVWPFDKHETWPRAIGARRMDTYHRWMEVVIPASLIGLPAVCVPAGFGAEGLPMGVQLIGRPGSDRMLLELAARHHAATPWPQIRPPVL
ncbi:amidase [Roseovarius sp. LXJ103]|uniref:amidase n=1 Tax=Roseovarius carneus TaxID=2853164 RepID=UPI000D6108F4|nr:amidase [Roseovarius carneus]MBZ8119221.1 amidase [Roseovarius carneus]PWE35153.1 amidase [Pelagicola sp. LXJ1103]